jgi:hypothetical protein
MSPLEFTRLAEGNVKLDYDQANNHLGHKDQYGRTRVYLPEDGRC